LLLASPILFSRFCRSLYGALLFTTFCDSYSLKRSCNSAIGDPAETRSGQRSILFGCRPLIPGEPVMDGINFTKPLPKFYWLRGNSERYNHHHVACFTYFCNREQSTNNSEIAVQFSFSSGEVQWGVRLLELNLGPPQQYHLATSLISVITVDGVLTPHAPSLRLEGNPVW
jgi:hypothetical protein